MAHVGSDRVPRDVQFVGDLRCRQVGGQVAQDPDLAFAERFERRIRSVGRRRGSFPGQQVEDPGDQGGVCGAVPGVALQQARRRLELEEKLQALGLSQIERAFQGPLGGGWLAECVPGDRLKQEGPNEPGRPD
jgi:hypothetical protein